MTMKDKLINLFGKAIDEAMTEEETAPAKDEDMKAMMDSIMKRMDAMEKAMAPTDEKPPEAAQVDEAKPEDADGEESAIMAKLSVMEKAIAKLAGLEVAEGAEDEYSEPTANLDAETIARAEILAPGLAKSKDMRAKSLTAAYGTEDGKVVINTLLGGKSFDSVDKDMLFVAASEMLKSTRRGQLHSTRVSFDSLPSMKAGHMTPEKLNEMNAARHGKK